MCRRRGPSAAALLALLTLAVGASGCSRIVTLFTGDTSGSVIDAHVVFRARPGCPTLLARSLQNGYSLMTPLEADAGPARDTLDAIAPLRPSGVDGYELTGVFEGPVHEGQSVFRYVPPAESETWGGLPRDVPVDVAAVRLDLADAGRRFDTLCGVPEGADAPADPGVSRLPGTR